MTNRFIAFQQIQKLNKAITKIKTRGNKKQ